MTFGWVNLQIISGTAEINSCLFYVYIFFVLVHKNGHKSDLKIISKHGKISTLIICTERLKIHNELMLSKELMLIANGGVTIQFHFITMFTLYIICIIISTEKCIRQIEFTVNLLCQKNTLNSYIMLTSTAPLQAILRDVMGKEKFNFSLFFIIHLCNDPCCHCIISPQCIHAGCFA